MIRFDSKDRQSNYTSSDFQLVLKDGLHSLEGRYGVVMIHLPVSFYNINSDNNLVPLYINGALNSVNITAGQYNVGDLITSLKTALESVSGGAVFTISVGGVSKKITIECDREFSFKFGDYARNICSVLGFENKNIDSGVAKGLTGKNVMNLVPIDTLSINIRGMSDGVIQTNGQSCTILVPINRQYGEMNIVEFEHPFVLEFTNKTRSFGVNVCDARTGKDVDLNGLDWWMLLKKY